MATQTLTALDLSDNYVFPRGVKAIAHALYDNWTLAHLDLSGCLLCGVTQQRYGKLDHSGVAALVETLR